MKSPIVLVLAVTTVVATFVFAPGMVSAHNTNSLAARELAYVPDEHLPVIDGVISPGEYDWVPAKFRVKMADYVANRQATNVGPWVSVRSGSEPYSPADFDVPFAFLGWSPERNGLIIALQAVDDIGYFDQPYSETWAIGSPTLYLDADHDGGQYEFYDPPRTGIDGLFARLRLEPGRGGRPDLPPWLAEAGVEAYAWALREPYVQTAITCDEATGSYVVETTMQLWDWMDTGGASASIPHMLTEGETIGMRFTVTDQDSDNFDDQIALSWNSASSEAYPPLNADAFDDWVLLGPEQTGIATGVEASSWGRIKNTFR